jgi:hypothetical protein
LHVAEAHHIPQGFHGESVAVNRTLIRVTMGTAVIMVGHQVAATALRQHDCATSSAADAPAQSAPQPTATRSSTEQ